MSFLLPVNGRHFLFSTYADNGQFYRSSFRVAPLREHGYSLCNFVPSCLQADKEVYPVLEAAISDFSLPVKSYNVPGSFIGQADWKNIGVAFRILDLCCLRAAIYVFKLKFWSGIRHLQFLLRITS